MEHMLPAHHHVHHILPISLGGVDHIDKWVYQPCLLTLGYLSLLRNFSYTHSTREHHKMLRSLPGYDGIAYNAFEVGITKITKAVERALATGKYKGPSAEELFDRGRELGRQERKAQQRRESISLASPLASPSN